MKRNTLTVLLCLFATAFMTAANYGVDHFALGEYTFAKKWFEQQLAQNPAESNYYLGEIAFKEGNVEAARAYFEKGLAADPASALNMVGKGKTLLKSSQKEAELLFKAALKLNKKDIVVNLAIVDAYKDNGMAEQAASKLNAARKVGKNSALLYIYEGNEIMAGTSETKVQGAIDKYSQAMYFDPESAVAQMKYAQVYQLTDSYDIPIDVGKKVVEAHPDYLIAIRDLAASYTNRGVYKLAIENYKKFFENGSYTINDIRRFAQSYFFNSDYKEAMTLIKEGLALEPDHFVLNRLRMYSASELKDSLGMEYATKFFSLRSGQGEDAKFIYKDYLAYAKILAKAERFEEALGQFEKVLASEEEVDKGDVYESQGEVYSKMGQAGKPGQYAKAGEMYENYISTFGVVTPASIYMKQGQAYYYAASELKKDSTDAGKASFIDFVTKADSAFSKTIEMSPDSYVGYMWRGNTNSLLDPESTKGLAKPHFEGAMNVILKKVEGGETLTTAYKNQLQRCYQYLAVYYFYANDKTNSLLYCEKTQEINPAEKVTKAIMDEYKRQELEAAAPPAKNAPAKNTTTPAKK